MSFRTYTTGIPDGPNNPSQDQPKMKVNTTSISQLISTDHYGFNNNQGGYHNIIHQPPTTEPAAIAGIGQVYVKTIGADQQLFYKSGGDVETQLSGVVEASSAVNGYTSLPGGLILQWGRIAGTHGAAPKHFEDGDQGTVTFATNNIAFPTNCFSVQLSCARSGSIPSGTYFAVLRESTLSNTAFTWNFTGSSSSITYIYWVAIGN